MRNIIKIKNVKVSLFITSLFIFLMTILNTAIINAADTEKAITISLLNQDPDPAIAGDIVEIRIGVGNQGGGALQDAVVEIEPEYPFSMLPGEERIQEIGTINAYQGGDNQKVAKYKMKTDRDVNAGRYSINIIVYSKSQKELTKTSTVISIDLKNKESAEVIHIDKATLMPGKESSLKFTINNVGNAPLRDLTFYWINDDNIILPVGSDNTKYIKYIEIGKSEDLDYQVIADTNAAPGLYKLNLYLSYDNGITSSNKSAANKAVQTIAGVYVGGETDFDIAFSESANGETSFTIANIGSNPASSVSIIIPEQKTWKLTGSNSAIIGNLNKGDYTVASFKLQKKISTQLKNLTGWKEKGLKQQKSDFENLNLDSKNIDADTDAASLQIKIAYTDTMGQRKVVEKEVTITAGVLFGDTQQTGLSGKRNQNTNFLQKYKWYLLGLTLLIIIVFGYRKIKKKRIIKE